VMTRHMPCDNKACAVSTSGMCRVTTRHVPDDDKACAGDRVENRIGTDFVDFTLYFSNLTNRLHL
jgi:hypothetical protein